MRLLIIVFSVMLSACVSSEQDFSKERPKDDPYADSTLNSVKDSQRAIIDQKAYNRRY